MLGLDVTLRTGATEAVLRRMSGLGPLGMELLLPALDQYRSVSEPGGPPVHDVCAVAWVAEPGLFGLVRAGPGGAGRSAHGRDYPRPTSISPARWAARTRWSRCASTWTGSGT